jgi:hypothetical protein
MLGRVRDNRALRRAAILGCGVALFAAPMSSLIVPIADALRQSPLIPGAGLLMAAMAVGELFAPVVVSKLQPNRTSLRAAALAAVLCACFLAAYGVASLVFSKQPELIVWVIVGVGFGAMKYGGRALNLGAATDADDDANSSEMVAAFVFLTSLASPIGVLAWGALINRVSVEAAILVGAVGTAAVAGLFLESAKTN